jgi:3-methyladenine DNA glycosylase/8-oxoguanine DNA glycosylase
VITHFLDLLCPDTFWFEDVVFAHGWVRLLPYRWCEDEKTLTRIESLPGGQLAGLAIRSLMSEGCAAGIRVEVTSAGRLTAAGEQALRDGLRRAFVLEEGFAGWWELCASEPGLRSAGERRQGRMLRSPTVFEDLVKTVCSINTTWSQTKAMVRNLVHGYGPLDPAFGEEARGFPPSAVLAAREPAELQAQARVGYRAEVLVGIARAVAEGRLELERLQDFALPDEEVARTLNAVRGLGPYAVAHMMMLLGRYDFLPVDTWLRRTVRDAWFDGRAVTDREIVESFERFRPYRSLAFRFYDWAGALRREVWTEE